MTIQERLRQLASALPSNNSAVTLTRADLLALAADAGEAVPSSGDLTVDEIAEEMGRASSTVRGWLIAGSLRGYKLNSRDWRVPRSALKEYVNAQEGATAYTEAKYNGVDISDWRKVRETDERRGAGR